MSNNELTPEEQKKFCDIIRGIAHDNELFSERRSSELEDEFTRLEVQIAAILIAFSGVFPGVFAESIFDAGLYSSVAIISIKTLYVCSVFFLIVSLIFGLIHIKRKSQFWDEVMRKRTHIIRQYIHFSLGKISFNDAISFHKGVSSIDGDLVYSPKWTWVLQTIFLSLAVLLFFVLLLVIIFTA